MTTDSPPEEIFLLPLRTRGSKAAAFTFVGMDLPLERGLKTTSGKDETINSHKIHTGGWGFIFTRGAWHHHHLLSDMVYAFIHAAMIKQLNVENRSLVKVMKQKSYFKFYGFKGKKKGGGGRSVHVRYTLKYNPLNFCWTAFRSMLWGLSIFRSIFSIYIVFLCLHTAASTIYTSHRHYMKKKHAQSLRAAPIPR